MRLLKRLAAAAGLALLSACATRPNPPPEVTPTAPTPAPAPAPVPVPPPSPVGRNAVDTGVKVETARVLKQDQAARALAAFRTSCPAVTTRTDASGLTQGSDWQALCAQAASLDANYAPGDVGRESGLRHQQGKGSQ